MWSDKLVADATAWAQHLAQTLRGVEKLTAESHARGISEGENIAQRSDSRGPTVISTADLLQGVISEKNGYQVAAFLCEDTPHLEASVHLKSRDKF